MVDVLANRHARRAPYRLPPTPVSLMSPSASAASTRSDSRAGPLNRGDPALTIRMGRVRRSRANAGLPEGALKVIALTKDQFRLTLLTVNAMSPTITARVQALDQLAAARLTLGMDASENFLSSQVHALTVVKFGQT